MYYQYYRLQLEMNMIRYPYNRYYINSINRLLPQYPCTDPYFSHISKFCLFYPMAYKNMFTQVIELQLDLCQSYFY